MSIDLTDPAVQAAINAAVQAHLAAAGVQAPVPVKELTPIEKVEDTIGKVVASIARDGNRVVDHFQAVVAALEAIYTVIKDVSGSAPPATPTPPATGGN